MVGASPWKPTSFYDLFGPRRSSRKGYNVSLSYNRTNTLNPPFATEWGASIAHYGDMDALPLYQDVEIKNEVTSFQTASAYFNIGKSLASIGAVTAEQGYSLLINGYTYLADGKFFPSLDIAGNVGCLLPVGEHNSFWLKTCVGQSFGDPDSVFGNSYFGGFRNNYVDNGAVNRYRSLNSMPGARIDQIGAHSYAKFTGERICFQGNRTWSGIFHRPRSRTREPFLQIKITGRPGKGGRLSNLKLNL